MKRTVLVMALLVGCGFSVSQSPWSSVSFDDGASTRLDSREVVHGDGSASNLVWVSFGELGGGWFVLDTGASVAVIDEAFADRLQLDRGRSVRANGAPAALRPAPPVSVGAMTVHDPVFVAIDLAPLLSTTGLGAGMGEVVGVIGYSVLQNAVVRIEYNDEEDEVFLHDSEEFALPSGETWIPVDMVDRAPIVTAEVAGASGRFKLDTGKTFAASLSREFAEEHDVRLDSLRMESNVRVEGVQDEATGEVEYIELAGLRIPNPTVGIRQGDQDGPLDGVIGRELLKHFVLTLDYSRGRVAVARRE